ncbi:MAG: REP-associated tyrosine transposase [Ferruginibacter sp.]
MSRALLLHLSMGLDGYKIRDQQAVHFITFAIVQWIDVFTRSDYVNIVIDSLAYCQQEKGLLVHAYCIMPNHLHLIISSPNNNLSDILRDFKKFTSAKIIKAIEENNKESRRNWMLWIFKKAGENNERNNSHQFWQQDNHPIECSTEEILQTRMNYLHENPVRSGLVWRGEDYRYSSAVDYHTTGKGLLKINR